ncbi:MAG: hypothetical protein RBT49_04850 [Bacteroidales bacterium]|jgi:ATP-binding cassette subfamily B protein|nr:hypothetical protein [Bacteroidales bacterium]
MTFPFYQQLDAMPACRLPVGKTGSGRDGDPSCLRMIAKHYGKNYTLQTLRDKFFLRYIQICLRNIMFGKHHIIFCQLFLLKKLNKAITAQMFYCQRIFWNELNNTKLRSYMQNDKIIKLFFR